VAPRPLPAGAEVGVDGGDDFRDRPGSRGACSPCPAPGGGVTARRLRRTPRAWRSLRRCGRRRRRRRRRGRRRVPATDPALGGRRSRRPGRPVPARRTPMPSGPTRAAWGQPPCRTGWPGFSQRPPGDGRTPATSIATAAPSSAHAPPHTLPPRRAAPAGPDHPARDTEPRRRYSGNEALEYSADCIATVWGATTSNYWTCPAAARSLVTRRLSGDSS
jgi:hypothetical protein